MRFSVLSLILVAPLALAAGCGGDEEAAAPTATPEPTATAVARDALPSGSIIFLAQGNLNFEIYRADVDGSGLANLTDHPAADWPGGWSPDGRTIAFTSYREGAGDVYLMGADGTEIQHISSTADRSEVFLSWSPDGARMLFGFFTETTGEYWVMDADGSNRRVVLPSCTDCGLLDWSPDGSQLVGYRLIEESTELFVVNKDGGGFRKLTDLSPSFPRARWSPSGGTIAFTRAEKDDMAIWLIEADGSELRRLFGSPDIREFSWAPDGRALAVGVLDRLVSVDADTGDVSLIAEGSEIFDVVVSPAGGYVAYTSRHEGNAEVYVVPFDGGAVVNVSDSPWEDVSPRWSPDGRQLIFRTDRDSLDGLYAMRPDGSGLTRLAEDPVIAAEFTPPAGLVTSCGDPGPPGQSPATCTSPDGRFEAIVRQIPGGPQLVVVNKNTGQETDRTPQDAFIHVKPAVWSPDGQRLAFYGSRDEDSVVRAGGDSALYVMEIESGQVVRLTEADAPANPSVSIQWSPEGMYLYYLKGGVCLGGCTQGFLYRIRSDGTGEAEQLTDIRVLALYGFAP